MWAILQYDNRPLTEEFKQLQMINQMYCNLHGYKYIFYKDGCNLPPYWCKVYYTQQLLKDETITGVLWLDMDAVVHTIFPISFFMKPGKSFYYTSDPPVWDGVFNAGVWMVKNTVDGRSIIDAWMKLYHPKDWTYDGTHWKSVGNWAGTTYEQGSFVEWILPKYKSKLYLYPWEYFQWHTSDLEGIYIYHFAGEFKKHIKSYLDQRLEDI
jgi:hypothetical protein